jgi:hypothetical protein
MVIGVGFFSDSTEMLALSPALSSVQERANHV